MKLPTASPGRRRDLPPVEMPADAEPPAPRPRVTPAPDPRPAARAEPLAEPVRAPRGTLSGADPWAAHAAMAGLEGAGSPVPARNAATTPPPRATPLIRTEPSPRQPPPAAPPVAPLAAPVAPPLAAPLAAPRAAPLAPPPATPAPAPLVPRAAPRGEEAPAPRRRRLPWSRAPKPAEEAAERLRALGGKANRAPPVADTPVPPAAEPAPPAETPAPRAGGADLPIGPLLEGFGALVALLLLDLVLRGNGFGGWPVSPFALPVLYVAARHGLVPGLAVGLAAGLLRIGIALSTEAWTANAWVEPLAWPCAALLVGFFTDRARTRAEAAERAAAGAALDRAAIAESNERLAARALELDARLGARLQAATAVFEASRALGHGTEGVIRGATGLLRAATGCTACSFWLAEDRTLHLVASEGWPPDATLSHHFLRGPLVDAIERGRGALVVTRPADRLALGGEGILAAPVPSPWDGLVLGMVKIEDIGFADLALDTVAALEAAAGWLGAALADARAREAADAAAIGSGAALPGGGVMVAGEDAARAIAAMTNLARRIGFDLALLSAEIPAGPRGAAALDATRAAITEAFRGSDVLLETRLDERRLSVLLPAAGLGGAEMAAARLRALLAERAPAATQQVIVGVAQLHHAGTHG